MTQKRTFWSVAVIPICFVLTSFFLELAMFIFMNIPFPRYYLVSLLFLIAFAGTVSCIPKRWIQIVVFVICIGLQTITTIGNLIAFHNLGGEIFIWETLRELREVFSGTGSVKYDGTWHFITIGLIVAHFIGTCIFIQIRFRKQKAGYPLRPLLAMATVIMVVFSGIFIHIAALDRRHQATNNFERLMSPRFNLTYFTDRNMVLFSFGSPIFYYNNLLKLFRFNSLYNSPIVQNIDRGWYTWEDTDLYNDGLTLDANYNAIFIMMENIESSAVNETVTPNLYKIQNKSTNVIGYHALERTFTTEYKSLTGGFVRGIEMWRDRQHTILPQSMPNIFRRSFEEHSRENDLGWKTPQINAFHTYHDEFYNRKHWFGRQRLGFDNFFDTNDFRDDDDQIDFSNDWQNYSDLCFMREVLDCQENNIAPADRPFFSYFLNVASHSPHFNATNITFENNQFTAIYPFCKSLRYILDINDDRPLTFENAGPRFQTLSQYFPRLTPEGLYAPCQATRIATVAYLVGVHHFDLTLGLILEHLENTYCERRNDGTKLIDTTALILYSDHFNHMVYNSRFNTYGGALTSQTTFESPIGEQIPFIIFNPRDQQKRIIETFMTNVDIYKTVAHLFNIPVHGNFTLGTSILLRPCNDTRLASPDKEFDYPISVGVGVLNGLFFGKCLVDPNLHFTTGNFRRFTTFNAATGERINHSTTVKPPQQTIDAFTQRMHLYADTLLYLRSIFDATNRFRLNDRFHRDPRTHLTMGNLPLALRP